MRRGKGFGPAIGLRALESRRIGGLETVLSAWIGDRRNGVIIGFRGTRVFRIAALQGATSAPTEDALISKRKSTRACGIGRVEIFGSMPDRQQYDGVGSMSGAKRFK
jgi:hypothetical protein